ncbi:MAG: IS66 family transposase [Planctomycetes bacterium]|jgi:transposase|nr:IS66 family transposase [Planctomycetota bacterium]
MTIEQLTEQLQQREAQLEQREATIAQLQATNAELAEATSKLRGELEWCKRQLFGRKSERYEDPNQPKLFDGASASAEGEGEGDEDGSANQAASTITVPSHSRRAGGRGKRQPIPDHLRRERIVHDLPADQRIDPSTGEPLLTKIGEEVSEKLAFRPGEVYVERHVRIKYRRPEENLSGERPEVVIAPASSEGLAKSIAAPSLLAEIAVRKYADHQPLDRLVKVFARHDVELSKASMCRWMQAIGELAAPLLALMKRRMLEHSVIIGHDDTPVRQQDPGSGRCRTSRFWTALGQVGTAGHYVLFDYTQNRSRAGPERWFRDEHDQPLFVERELQCDAYAGYGTKSGAGGPGGLLDREGPWRMVHVGCWAHARRKFHDARLNAPGPACEALGMIRQLYGIEAKIKDASHDQRCAARQAEAGPIVDAFFNWCAEQQAAVLPRSAMGEALTYALNQQASLRRYLDAGHRPIDNNATERTLRGLAIGRKNWLFTGSEAGGHAAARLFSLIGSARLHGVEPLAYLHALIRHLPATPIRQLDQFLPDRWAANAENH